MNEDYSCEVEEIKHDPGPLPGETTTSIQNFGVTVTYKASLTPTLTEILPRYGAVEGNEEVKFIGENFNSADTADYTIILDDVPCVVSAVTSTEVTCTTGPRIGKWEQDPKLEFSVAGAGKAAT